MSNSPKQIAITGGIGSGKTYICSIFETLGVPVYYSDTKAKNLVNQSNELKNKIQSLLGSESYLNGAYNTKFVALKVFENKDLLQKLNAIIHPAVALDYKAWLEGNKKHFYLLKESALIFELSMEAHFHKTILVTADQSLRVERVLKRDSWRSQEEVEAIFNKQWSDADKVALANFTISTNESELLLPHIIKIHQELTA